MMSSDAYGVICSIFLWGSKEKIAELQAKVAELESKHDPNCNLFDLSPTLGPSEKPCNCWVKHITELQQKATDWDALFGEGHRDWTRVEGLNGNVWYQLHGDGPHEIMRDFDTARELADAMRGE